MTNPFAEPINTADQQQYTNHPASTSKPPMYPTNEYNPLVDPTPSPAQSPNQPAYPQIAEPTNVQVYPNPETDTSINANPTPSPQPVHPQTYPQNIPTSDVNPFVGTSSTPTPQPSPYQPYQQSTTYYDTPGQSYTQTQYDSYVETDNSKPIEIESHWIESTVDQEQLFYYAPNGNAILPSRNSYYPPVKQIVYDKEGRAYKAHFPPAVTNAQKLAQKQVNFNRKVVQPVGEALEKISDVINQGARSFTKLFRPRH